MTHKETQQALKAKLSMLEQRITELEAMNHNKTLWLASLAHDFKGIFSNILWLNQNVKAGTVDKDALWDLFPDLNASAKHNLKVLEATFSAAKLRIQAGKTVQNNIQFSVIFQAIKTHFKEALENKKVLLECVGNPQDSLKSDPLLLLSVLYNVVDNAIKFSHPDGKVVFHAEQTSPRHARFIVEDTGTGMSEKTLARVFALDHAPFLGTQQELGLGFGLPMVKEVLYTLGGNIEISSIEHQGTRVLIHI